jgi:RNA polymerase sigma factor (sigma-70 family)
MRNCWAWLTKRQSIASDDLTQSAASRKEKCAGDKFSQLFMKKLWGLIANSRRRRKLSRMLRQLRADILDPRMSLRKLALIIWVREAVANLPTDDRDLIRRVYWEGWAFSAVALAMGIGKTTVGDRHDRIITALRNDCFGYVRLLDALEPGEWGKFW